MIFLWYFRLRYWFISENMPIPIYPAVGQCWLIISVNPYIGQALLVILYRNLCEFWIPFKACLCKPAFWNQGLWLFSEHMLWGRVQFATLRCNQLKWREGEQEERERRKRVFQLVLVKMEGVWAQDIRAGPCGAGAGHRWLSANRCSFRSGAAEIHLSLSAWSPRATSPATQARRPLEEWL